MNRQQEHEIDVLEHSYSLQRFKLSFAIEVSAKISCAKVFWEQWSRHFYGRLLREFPEYLTKRQPWIRRDENGNFRNLVIFGLIHIRFVTMAPVSTALLVLTMVLLLMPRDCPAQLVVRQKDISVDIGRSTFLGREDLVVSSVRRGESCRIEVVTNDPITQRVGRIHPPVS